MNHMSGHNLKVYSGMIAALDRSVGLIIQNLKELDIYENTLVIFTSDNGPTYAGGADTPFFDSAKPFKTEYGWAKGFVHEGGIRVPMIASWPGRIKRGSRSNHISAFQDMMPTFCDIIGIPIPNNTDGISMKPTLFGKNQSNTHEYLYWEFPAYKGQQAVRMGKWKAIRRNIFDGNMKIELYDLNSDYREQNDVASAHPEIILKIKNFMVDSHTRSHLERFHFSQLGD